MLLRISATVGEGRSWVSPLSVLIALCYRLVTVPGCGKSCPAPSGVTVDKQVRRAVSRHCPTRGRWHHEERRRFFQKLCYGIAMLPFHAATLISIHAVSLGLGASPRMFQGFGRVGKWRLGTKLVSERLTRRGLTRRVSPR